MTKYIYMNTEKINKLYSLTKKDPVAHITEQDIKSLFDKDELDIFYKFMNGQGCPLIDGKPCYYPWDVSRFIRNHVK